MTHENQDMLQPDELTAEILSCHFQRQVKQKEGLSQSVKNFQLCFQSSTIVDI